MGTDSNYVSAQENQDVSTHLERRERREKLWLIQALTELSHQTRQMITFSCLNVAVTASRIKWFHESKRETRFYCVNKL